MFYTSPNMILFVVALLFPWKVLGDPVVGGHFCDIRMNPWLASIQKNDYHLCGGSILSKNIILTSAHCVYNNTVESLIVRVGSSRSDSGGSWHRVVFKKIHEGYQRMDHGFPKSQNDLALLKVSPSIEFGNIVANIRLADKGYNNTPGSVVSVAGWGAVSFKIQPSIHLVSTNLQIVDSAECARAYGDKEGTIIRSNKLICAAANGSDACYGDSGGPLVMDDVQVGIVASGIKCANPEYPGLYVDVSQYRDWINTHLKMLDSLKSPENMP